MFCGVKFFLETRSVSRDYGVSYDVDLSEQERKTVESLVDAETKYALPIKITAKTVANKEDFAITELIPTADWYSLVESISSAEALNLASSDENVNGYSLVEVDRLDGTRKLLAIDDNYYLDNPEKGDLSGARILAG